MQASVEKAKRSRSNWRVRGGEFGQVPRVGRTVNPPLGGEKSGGGRRHSATEAKCCHAGSLHLGLSLNLVHTTTMLALRASTSRVVPLARAFAAQAAPAEAAAPAAAARRTTPRPRTQGYIVERSAQGNLPVYSEYRNARSNRLTVVRKITGDVGVSLSPGSALGWGASRTGEQRIARVLECRRDW